MFCLCESTYQFFLYEYLKLIVIKSLGECLTEYDFIRCLFKKMKFFKENLLLKIIKVENT